MKISKVNRALQVYSKLKWRRYYRGLGIRYMKVIVKIKNNPNIKIEGI